MPTAVPQDHGMMRRHSRNRVAPIVGVGEAALQGDRRRALAVDRIMDLNAVGFGFAAAIGGDRRRRWRQGLPPLSGETRQRGAGEEGGEGERAHEASPRLGPGSFSLFLRSCKRATTWAAKTRQ